MQKNEAVIRGSSPLDEKSTVEVHQSSSKLFGKALGIIFSILGLLLTVGNLSYLGSSAWWLLIPLGYVILDLSIEMYLRIFFSPQRMVIRETTLTVYMLFKEEQIMSVLDIEEVRYVRTFGFVIEAGGWLICPIRNLEYLIAKPFYYQSNFDAFISAIRERNPRCRIDERILEWKGPYSGA